MPRPVAKPEWFARVLGWTLLLAVAMYALWAWAGPGGANFGEIPLASGKGLALFAAFIVVHELLHYAAYPRPPGRRVVWGLDLRRGAFFVGYRGMISRERRLFAALLPFVAISFGALALAIFTGSTAPELAFLSFWNALGSAGDVDNVTRILRQVPRGERMLQDDAGVWIRERAL